VQKFKKSCGAKGLIMDNDVYVLQRKTEKAIHDLEGWFNRNDLIINVKKKIGIMSFHNRQVKVPTKPQVTLNDSPLEYVADLNSLVYVLWRH
jgi:hypothetical protein